MKAALIGAVAMGGATAAALTWTYLATGDSSPPGERPASAPVVPAEAPAVSAASNTPAQAVPDRRDRAAPVPVPDSPGPAKAPDLATRGTPSPTGGIPAPAMPPDRLAAVAPGAAVRAAPPPAIAARDPAPPDAPRADLAPSFDVVRVEADGQTVIAGRAAPNERVEVLLDGRVVETMLADARGRFVAVLSTGHSPGARELRLRVTLPAQAPPARSGPARAPDDPEPPPAAGSGRGSTAASMAPQTAPPDAAARRPDAADNVAGAGTGSLRASQPAPAALGAGAPAPSLSVPPDVPAPGREPGGAGPAAAALAPPAGTDGGGYLLSDAVIILPTERAGDAPALVRLQDERLALLQPGGAEATGVVLDQLTREPGGDLLLRGRARPGHAVRIYGNDEAIGTVPVADGGWSLTVPDTQAGDIRLFRLDEIARSGAVASRIEVPFQPSDAPSQVVRERRITVRRGDNLWRIAEQNYGEGIRYSLIFGANSDLIRDPDLIYPDQVFTVPELVEAE